MQDKDYFSSMPASLAAKVSDYADYTAAKAYNICKRNNVPQDVADVFILDAIDILRAQYVGLRATTEQMRALTDSVPQRSWDRTENAALCFMARYYADIVAYFDGGAISLGVGFINAVVVCEIAKRTDGGQPFGIDGSTIADVQDEAQRLYYTYAILTAAEFCNASEDELKDVQPYGVTLTDEQKRRAIAAGLNFNMQRQRFISQRMTRAEAAAAPLMKGRTDTGGLFDSPRALPHDLQPNKTIKQFQNIAFMIGSGVQTSDMREDGGSSDTHPLWQAVEEQRQAAIALMNDENAGDDEKRQAAQLITNTYAVTQVIDGLQILPQVVPPDSGTTTRMIWEMSIYDYARTILGAEKPKKDQVTALLRATAFLSTQRMAVAEKSTKRVVQRDSSGEVIHNDKGQPLRKKVEKEIITNFQPVVVEFRTEYENKVLIEDATRIRVEVHRLFADGRSAQYVGNGKSVDYIDAPRQQYLTIGQFYDFDTENERIFRNIILSKPKQAEDTLLSSVFNYPKRQAEQDAKAAEAMATAEQTRAAAEAIKRNPTATPEQIADAQKQAAEAEAEAGRAATQAKYYISNHKGDDVKRIKAMFEKALQNGLITSYYAEGREARSGRRGVVWYWRRPTHEDVRAKR